MRRTMNRHVPRWGRTFSGSRRSILLITGFSKAPLRATSRGKITPAHTCRASC